MAVYMAVPDQIVQLNGAILFNSSIPSRGVYHTDGTGVFILRGPSCGSPNCFARYAVSFTGNIGLTATGTAGPIAIGVGENGEVNAASIAVTNPTAALQVNNVATGATIDVPRGINYILSLRHVAAPTATTPATEIEVPNGILNINRIA